MTKLVLLTGFLGAGKTTLLKRILSCYANEKIGVIINEFGKVNVDARLVARPGLTMEELSGGSVFCACIKDNFVESLIEMSNRDLEYVFVEASGLADPANMGSILEGLKNVLDRPYDYKGSLCVIDAKSFAALYELLPAINYQLEFSGAAVVNKADLVSEEELSGILKTVSEVNPAARIYVCSYCAVDIKEAVEGLRPIDKAARESTNTVESRPVTFVLKGLAEVPGEKLERLLDEVAPHTYRIKGFAVTDKGYTEVSAVGSDVEIKLCEAVPAGGADSAGGGNKAAGDAYAPENDEQKTEIVVISSVGIKIMSILTKSIENCGLKGIVRL